MRLKLAITPLLVVLLLISVANIVVANADRSDAYKSYLSYLSYQRIRLDAEHHPDEKRQTAAAADAAKRKSAIEKLEMDKVREAVRKDSNERTRISQILKSENDALSSQLTKALSEVEALEFEDKEVPGALEKRAAWLGERAKFFRAESQRFGGSGKAKVAGAKQIYAKLVDLHLAKIESTKLTDPKERALAAATVRVLQKQLDEGATLAQSRPALSRRELSLTMRDFRAKSEKCDRQLRSVTDPARRATLDATKEFLQSELVALGEIRKKAMQKLQEAQRLRVQPAEDR